MKQLEILLLERQQLEENIEFLFRDMRFAINKMNLFQGCTASDGFRQKKTTT